MIDAVNVKKSFINKKAEHEVLKNITIHVQSGKLTALVGKNGAGKTTLLRIIAGLHDIDEGELFIGGEPQSTKTLSQRKNIGVLFGGDTGLYNRLTVREHLEYYGFLYGLDESILKKRISLLEKDFQMGSYMNRRVKHFSKGMKQKVAISKSMVHDPDIYLFDEPTTGLDIIGSNMFREKVLDLKAKNKTVLFSSHNMEEVALCDDIIILHEGTIHYEGPLNTLYKENNDWGLNKIVMNLINEEL
ncbi:ATP-binding cassette domain-containing protein [Oceanobacillus jeddahense]|uniref:ABC transporter ATP-binding protein n=1 Tax=Oceanobacillus jeddahense TaxID=1462527 RepID=UPI000595E013|nr:ATP-binding cassette domain-containing protein [Oceanobacillus jeddahense]